jgi:hypothetical protein
MSCGAREQGDAAHEGAANAEDVDMHVALFGLNDGIMGRILSRQGIPPASRIFRPLE